MIKILHFYYFLLFFKFSPKREEKGGYIPTFTVLIKVLVFIRTSRQDGTNELPCHPHNMV